MKNTVKTQKHNKSAVRAWVFWGENDGMREIGMGNSWGGFNTCIQVYLGIKLGKLSLE